MRKTLFYASLLIGGTLFGQLNGTISGQVLDQGNNQPLAFASVVLKTQEEAIISGTITDNEGKFKLIELAAGTYVLEIEFIGFASKKTTISIKGDEIINLPVLYLSESAERLEGVTITSQKSTIEQRLDRKVVNVGKDLISQGPSAIDLMNNLPSVNINSDGNLSFRGSENVRILVDGKLSNLENPAEVLQQIPSNSIKKIELITNPSAKYNPDGLNGIINIVLKKTAQEGWNMAFSANSIIAQEERYSSSLSLNFKPKKTNYYLEYNNGFGDQIIDGLLNRFDLNSNQITRSAYNRKSNVIKLGVDFYPFKNTIFSVFTNQNFYNLEIDGDKNVVFEDDASMNFALNDLLIRDNHTQTYNADYKWLIDGDAHFLELEANYDLFNGDLTNDFDFNGNTTVPSYIETIDDTRSVLTMNLDYSLPLGEKAKLEMGGESRVNRIENDYSSTNVELQNSVFQYNRDIYSSYLIYSTALGKFNLNLGSRFEYYLVDASFNQGQSSVQLFNQELFNAFPSVFVSYKPSEESPHQYQLSYGRRIERPSFRQVNPIRQTTTPQVLVTGNFELRPQFSNSVEANYLYRFNKGSISSSVFYRRVQDEINRIGIFDQDDPNLLRLSYDNFDSNDAYGIEVGGNLRFANWWRTNVNMELYTRQQRGNIEGEEVTVQNTLANLKWSHNFILSKHITAALFGFYSGRQEILQYELKPNYYMNMGLRYNFANGKGSLSINANDVFGTQRFAFETYRTVFQEGQFLRDTQQVFFGLSYRLGGKLSSVSRKKRNSNIKKDRFL
ncbi:TonB-dependent receptor domain-containing protein [Flagellimonas sp.]|uniref:TonB-dependent receptor domain-containing protein n=1 Tax=Flagellimonas sp. TaxID=2058762 RepID=UPI003B5C4C6E